MLDADMVVVAAAANDTDGGGGVLQVDGGMRYNSGAEEENDSCGGGGRPDGFKNSGIAVEANGRALKVHAGDVPHLVSLGSDRFSTAVTVHPLPKGT